MLKESAIVEGEFYGRELDGIHYVNPLEANVPMQKEFRKYHRIIMAKELVSSAEGSGIVHIAPGHGLEDYLVGRENKLPIFSPVDGQWELHRGGRSIRRALHSRGREQESARGPERARGSGP